MHTTPPRLRLLTGLATLLASAGIVVGSALPAAAHAGGPVHYVALGDSYAAGQASDCSHPATSYPLRLDALRTVKLLRDRACASATTSTVLSSQLRAVNRGTELVTITVGANDLDVAGLVAVCTPDPSTDACGAALLAREAELPGLYADLVATYSAIAARAPRAEILVTGYPALLSAGPIADAEALLNATIQRAVDTVAATGVNIRYVPVDFSGHTVDSADPWFYRSGPDQYHPTPAGEQAIAAALENAI
jgi:lysophospholipase L1-like esterase